MSDPNNTKPKNYQTPKLEQQTWTGITGISLPIGTSAFDNPLEMNDFMEGEQCLQKELQIIYIKLVAVYPLMHPPM